MPANYNIIAPFYDALNKLVFGNATLNAQLWLIEKIKSPSRILIAGGGTGWIIEKLSEKFPDGLDIVYVEISFKMMSKSKKRNCFNNKVSFMLESIEDIHPDKSFDYIIAPFFFDNFTQVRVLHLISHIQQYLRPEGYWLVADFVRPIVLWQKILLKIMYMFFKTFCSIESTKMPELDFCFQSLEYKAVSACSFFHGFIKSSIYKRLPDH